MAIGGNGFPVTELALPPPTRSDAMVDGLAAALFAVFVTMLLLGYLDPSFPYNGLAALPLLGALGMLLWANRRSDLLARGGSSVSIP
jgi:hypothetical protein